MKQIIGSCQKILQLCMVSTLLAVGFHFNTLSSLSVGSNTTPSRQSHITFPQVGTDNTMLGFAAFENGFTLQSPTTTCTFSDFFPVSGNINLHGGLLYLNNDFYMGDVASLLSSGVIIGNNHDFEFSSSVTGIPSSFNTLFKDSKISVNSDLRISGTVTFKGDCTLNANWNRIILETGAQLIIDRNSKLSLKNMQIEGLVGSNLRCNDDGGRLILDDITWQQSNNFTFSNGSIKVNNDVCFGGKYNFSYQSRQTSTIDTASSWCFSNLNKFIIGRQASVFDREPLYFVDRSSQLYMQNTTLNVNSNGMQFTRGTMIIDGEVVLDITSTLSTKGLHFGNGTTVGDIEIQFTPDSVLNHLNGAVVHDIIGVNNFFSGNVQKSFIRRGATTTFYFFNNTYFNNVYIRRDLVAPTFTNPGIQLFFINCPIVIPSVVDIVLTATRLSEVNYLLDNGGSIILQDGVYPLMTTALGVNNLVSGKGQVSGPLIIHDNSSELKVGISDLVSGPIIMNGGTLRLQNSLYLDKSIKLTGSGTVKMANYDFYLGDKDLVWTSTVTFDSTGSRIKLKSKLVLASTITASGDCTIDGGDNILDLTHAGNIIVAPNSKLRLRNVNVKNAAGSNIRCADNSGSVVFENVNWLQSEDFIFDKGSLLLSGDVTLRGEHTFAYQSNLTSTIDTDSVLYLDSNFTFSYDPQNARPDLLYFSNKDSILYMHNATLYTTRQSLNLTRGGFIVDESANLYAELDSLPDGISLGNNNLDDDIKTTIKVGSFLTHWHGNLIYKNVDPSSWIMLDTLATLKINAGALLAVEQNLDLGLGRLQLSTSAGFEVDGGASFTGNVEFF